MDDGASFDQLVSTVHQAAIDPQAWAHVISALGNRHGGTRFLFVGTVTADGSSVPHVHLGYAPEAAASYVAHYQHLNPWWQGWQSLQVGSIGHSALVHPEADLRRGAFYNEWLRPQEDLDSGVGTVLLRDRTRQYLLAGNLRRRDRDRMTGAVGQTLRRIAPVMNHALAVNRMILGLRLEREAGPGDTALAVVAERGRAVFLNHAAERLADDGAILRLDHAGRLSLTDARADEALRAILAGRPGVRPELRVAGGAAGPMVVRVVPLSSARLRALGFGPLDADLGAAHLIALARPSGAEDPAAVLVARLGLSRSEAEVLIALSAGQSPREIAEGRRTSLHTVRNQIKSAMARAGVARQADLMRLADRLLAAG